jgi:hypothetical protein
MKTLILPFQTIATLKVNRKLIITYTDLIAWNDTAQAIVPENTVGAATKEIKAGTQVANFLVNVTTAFAGGGTITTFVLEVGDDGDTNRFVSDGSTGGVDLLTTGWKAGIPTPYLYVAANTIDALSTYTLNAHTVAELTAGEVEIYYLERDLTSLPLV